MMQCFGFTDWTDGLRMSHVGLRLLRRVLRPSPLQRRPPSMHSHHRSIFSLSYVLLRLMHRLPASLPWLPWLQALSFPSPPLQLSKRIVQLSAVPSNHPANDYSAFKCLTGKKLLTITERAGVFLPPPRPSLPPSARSREGCIQGEY